MARRASPSAGPAGHSVHIASWRGPCKHRPAWVDIRYRAEVILNSVEIQRRTVGFRNGPRKPPRGGPSRFGPVLGESCPAFPLCGSATRAAKNGKSRCRRPDKSSRFALRPTAFSRWRGLYRSMATSKADGPIICGPRSPRGSPSIRCEKGETASLPNRCRASRGLAPQQDHVGRQARYSR